MSCNIKCKTCNVKCKMEEMYILIRHFEFYIACFTFYISGFFVAHASGSGRTRFSFIVGTVSGRMATLNDIVRGLPDIRAPLARTHLSKPFRHKTQLEPASMQVCTEFSHHP